MKPSPSNWASPERSCQAAVAYPKTEPLARSNVGFVGAKAGELASNLASAPSKHRFGMARAYYKGAAGFERYVGFCVMAQNLVAIVRTKTKQTKPLCRSG